MGPPRTRLAFLLLLPLLGLGVTLTSCRGGRDDRQALLAYVASAGNNQVRVIDLASGETLRKIYTGATPWRLVLAPGGNRLWVQHWYAATTAVIDLEDHEVLTVLPVRGPGAFDAETGAFLSFSWPDSTLYTFDGESFEPLEQRTTEIRQVYDVLPGRNGEDLYLAQYDPMARGPSPRYGYVLSYPYRRPAESAVPKSIPSGAGPVALAAPPGQPFLVTADSGTNGLSLINELGDGRNFAACPAPRAVAFAPDASRMAVVCWLGDGRPQSEVVIFRTDFEQRPWPSLEESARATLGGGLVAAAFTPDGETVWLVDRNGGRLLELAAASAEVRREIAAGDVPVDLILRLEGAEERERLLSGESRGRRLARETLARLAAGGARFTDLTWTEETVRAEQVAAPEAEAPVRRVRFSLRLPDAARIESGKGDVRLARDGWSLTRDGEGRFWVTPRQELLSTVLALPALSPEEAIRRLAGDVPGSPFLRGGLAMDLATDVTEEGRRFVVLGADRAGRRISQLWVDAETGRPASLVEQFPRFQPAGAEGHGGAPGVEIVETRFADFVDVEGRYPMPTSLERILEQGWVQLVRLTEFAADRGLPAAQFDLSCLGGVEGLSEALFRPAAADSDGDGPGRSVPVQRFGGDRGGEALPGLRPLSTPYNSSPPTSGAHLPYAADWGVHDVPVPLPLQVHNLIDGGVALQYKCPEGCPELVARLAAVARDHDQVLVAPYPLMEGRLALTAWGRVDELEDFDRDRIEDFIDAWGGRDHHREVGAPPPMARGHGRGPETAVPARRGRRRRPAAARPPRQ